MKRKYIILLLFIGITILSAGQDTGLNFQSDVKNGALQVKNGNRWDAFGNFIQLMGNDLTGDNKGVQFKGVLFPIFCWDSVKRNQSKYYLSHTWLRNSELQAGFKFAKNNSVNAISVGYNYAILNLRDKSLQDFYFSREDSLNDIMKNSIFAFTNSLPQNKRQQAIEAVNSYKKTGKIAGADSIIVKAFIKLLDDSIKAHPVLHAKTYSEALKSNRNIYDSLVELVSRRPLLTFNPSAQYNPLIGEVNGIKGTLELIFAVGKRTSKKPWEFDLKFDFTSGDTTTNKSNLQRQEVFANLGVNKVLLTGPDRKTSVIEFKIGGEVDIVTNSISANEDRYKYFANTTLRIKAGKSLWFPVTLKYDLKNANLLGFLNISLNLDSNSGKSSN
jgi:hypothetical protein